MGQLRDDGTTGTRWFGDRATHGAAKRPGVTAVIDKPFDIDEFRAFV